MNNRSFRDFLNESIKLTKSEQSVIDLFIGDESSLKEVSEYKGTGSVRGGGAKTGKAQVAAVKKLVKKGILEIDDYESSSYTTTYKIKLLKPEFTSKILTDDELYVLRDVLLFLLSDKRSFRKMSKKEDAAMKVLVQRKIVKYYSTLDPEIVKGSIDIKIKKQLLNKFKIFGLESITELLSNY